jgi:hypothetical protein
MTVYVDELEVYPNAWGPFLKGSCHMYVEPGTDIEELHRMAVKIGMKRAWFQQDRTLPHYDLVPSKRAKAVREGAKEHGRQEMVEVMRAWRAHWGAR